MTFDHFTEQIRTTDALESIIGTPSSLALKKELTALDEHMRRFIAHSPFVVISTVSTDGRCDASPRGDPAGSIYVIDDKTLLIPDRPGNRRADSLRNILETGNVGLLFMVPGFGETLRVNGKAVILRDEKWLTTLEANGKRPALAIAVLVEQCFLQCAKALLRSKLWDLPERPSIKSLPCAAEMLAHHVQMPEYDEANMQSLLDGSYKNNLY